MRFNVQILVSMVRGKRPQITKYQWVKIPLISALIWVSLLIALSMPVVAFPQSPSTKSWWYDPFNNALNYAPFPSAQAVCDARQAITNFPKPLVFFANGDCRYAPFAGWMVMGTSMLIQCGSNARFFEDAKTCVGVTKVPPPPGNNPKDSGPNCGAQPEIPQPSCGQPINPGTGNMWHTEPDYAVSATQSGLTLTRTINTNPYSWDADLVRAFGRRWTQPYDAVLKPETPSSTPNVPPATCWMRNDNGYVWCETPGLVASPFPQAVSIVRGDGKKTLFNLSNGSWISDADVNDRVTATYNADQSAILGWIYVSARGDVTENYNANGLLTAITSRSGTVQRLTYSNGVTNDTSAARIPADAPVCSHSQASAVLPAGRLLCVTDNWGRQLQFAYDTQGRITQAIDPLGLSTTYAYDGASGGCAVADANNRACAASNLTQVTYPDGKSRTYVYNEAAQINGGTTCANTVVIGNGYGHLINTLTGLIDENGARHISWTYDCQGRATSSAVGDGVEKVVLAYGTADTNGNSTTTVTHYLGTAANPLTTVRSLAYQQIMGVAKNVSIDQPCVECGPTKSRTYDGNGNTASRTDWNGNVMTYSYDLTRNLETSRVEASGTPQARTIVTSWHATYRLPIAVAEPLRKTTFSYDGAGNLLSKAVQATSDATGSQGLSAPVVGVARTSSYTYNQFGQVLTATGPRTEVADITRYSYDATTGNLLTIINAAGQPTTLSNYDANGRVGKIIDANGTTTDLTYHVRGWLTSKRITAAGGGNGQTTSYSYDGVGQLTQVTLPDNASITYTYDDAHRLTTIADSLGNQITYTLDAMGNRVSEQVKDPQGTLARQTTRIYDALNRLQQVTGAVQ